MKVDRALPGTSFALCDPLRIRREQDKIRIANVKKRLREKA